MLGNILLKRDDLAGFGQDGRSGVKARKLEGLLAFLNRKGITSLELPLGNITNLGADLAGVARQFGISLKFLVLDDPPLPSGVREELFRTMDAQVRFMGASWPMAGLQIAIRKVASLGSRHFVTVPSPSHPTAVLGATAGYLEAISQAKAAYGVTPRAVYIASAAGSTVAGFALGEALMRRSGADPVEIVAVPVVDQPVGFCARTLARWTAHSFDFGSDLTLNLSVAKDPRNLRYGRYDAALEDVCRRVEQGHSVAIDPIYGGKSWRTMEDREGAASDARPVLFWHCGYTYNWLTCREHLLDAA